MSTVDQTSSTLSERLDSYVKRKPYILDDAWASYRHWWEWRTGWCWSSYGLRPEDDIRARDIIALLYPHLEEFKTKRRHRRHNYTRGARDHCPAVEHVVVLPCGEEITYGWRSEHGHYRSSLCPFRRPRPKIGAGTGEGGVDVSEDPYEIDRLQAKRDWRRRKLKDYRRHGPFPSRYPWGGAAKTHAKNMQNREDRREARRLMRLGRHDEVRTVQAPRDAWAWD